MGLMWAGSPNPTVAFDEVRRIGATRSHWSQIRCQGTSRALNESALQCLVDGNGAETQVHAPSPSPYLKMILLGTSKALGIFKSLPLSPIHAGDLEEDVGMVRGGQGAHVSA